MSDGRRLEGSTDHDRNFDVAVAVVTLRRPRLLAGLLQSLSGQVVPHGVRVSLVVVDNDADGSASDVVDAVRGQFRWPVTYDIEPVRNISRARNRAVSTALEDGAAFVAFIDDDERAPEGWLGELLRVQHETGADIVTGPVCPRLHGSAPSWAAPGLFTDSKPRPTGVAVRTAITSNALVTASVLRSLEGPFDERFGLTGGGDSHLFLRATQAGAKIVWADDARTEEVIGPERTTLKWIAQRAFREGNAGVFVESAVLPHWRRRRLFTTGGRLALATAIGAASLSKGRTMAVVALRHGLMALGALAAIAGYRYHEYREPRSE